MVRYRICSSPAFRGDDARLAAKCKRGRAAAGAGRRLGPGHWFMLAVVWVVRLVMVFAAGMQLDGEA
jgi:hypothetical protein